MHFVLQKLLVLLTDQLQLQILETLDWNARQATSSVQRCILCKFTANVHGHLHPQIQKRLAFSNLNAKDSAAALSPNSKTKQVIRGSWIPKLHRICRKHAALPEHLLTSLDSHITTEQHCPLSSTAAAAAAASRRDTAQTLLAPEAPPTAFSCWTCSF